MIYVSYPYNVSDSGKYDFELDYSLYVTKDGLKKGSLTRLYLPPVTQAKYIEVAEWFQYSMYNRTRTTPSVSEVDLASAYSNSYNDFSQDLIDEALEVYKSASDYEDGGAVQGFLVARTPVVLTKKQLENKNVDRIRSGKQQGVIKKARKAVEYLRTYVALAKEKELYAKVPAETSIERAEMIEEVTNRNARLRLALGVSKNVTLESALRRGGEYIDARTLYNSKYSNWLLVDGIRYPAFSIFNKTNVEYISFGKFESLLTAYQDLHKILVSMKSGESYGSHYEFYKNSCATATGVVLEKLYGTTLHNTGMLTEIGYYPSSPQQNINAALKYAQKYSH